MPESFLIRTVGGPLAGDRIAEDAEWPLPTVLPDPEGRGAYWKRSESQLPPQDEDSRIMRGAEYEWVET